ncbi:MAG: FapA family protein, partial [Lachnospiraceae bacterium]|nr:FapA family protein [Lachnospiraceae bacterium]
AKGHVVSKFLENATVEAGDYISTESAMNCHLSSGNEIEVTGKKGFIAGGDVIAASKVSAKTLGSNLGATTNITVGISPELKKEMAGLQKTVQENNINISKMEPILNNMFRRQAGGEKLEGSVLLQLQTLSQTRRQKMEENRKMLKRIDEITQVMDLAANPCVVCTGEVYSGVKITIGDVSKYIKDAVSYCKFIREGGDVRMTGI